MQTVRNQHKISVVESGRSIDNDDLLRSLQDRKLLKTLSLYLATKHGIAAPDSLLILDDLPESWHRACEILADFSFPVMVRMDFSKLPRRKPLGGVSIYTEHRAKELSSNMLRKGLLPLFHPEFDRHLDLYSVGIVIEPKSPEVQVEVVGRGFDASDLRLGRTIPHESLKCCILDGAILDRSVITEDAYTRSRTQRIDDASKLYAYEREVNRKTYLRQSLRSFEVTEKDLDVSSDGIPIRYKPLGKKEIQKLVFEAWKIKSSVIKFLPHSERYIASFSMLPSKGWMLWDIYGHWYSR